MTKIELVEKVAEATKLPKKQAGEVVNVVFNTIAKALTEGDKLQIIGFGSFEVRERAARTGVNPRTGEAIDIPAAKVPVFKPGKALKEAVNG